MMTIKQSTANHANTSYPAITASGQQKSLCDLGLILGLHPPIERRRYFVTPSLIGRAQT